MRRFAYFLQMTAVCAMSLFFAGCGSVASSTPTSSHADRDHGHDNHHGENGDDSHVHGNTKPHGGFLIELGHDHKYHAELVEDEATETVAVHILDARLNEVAIGESSILIQLTADGQTAAYELVAARNDEKENRSRFESKDQGLFRSLHRGDSFGKLRVSIDGAPYVGRIAHHEHDHHDHDGHDHDNHDHDNHDHDNNDHDNHDHDNNHD